MRFRVIHKITTFLLAIVAVLTLAANGSLSPLALTLVALGLGLAFYLEPGSRLGDLVERAARLVNAVSLILLALVVVKIGRSFPDVDLSPFLDFVLFLLVVKLCQRRSNRDYLQIFILSFLVMLAAAWTATSALFMVGFALYTVLTTWALILFHLRREIEDNYIVRHSTRGPAEPVVATRVLNSRRVVGAPFLAATAGVAAAVLVGSALVFALVPRVGLGFILGGVRRAVGIAGFTDEVKLGRHGLISTDNGTVVMHCQIPALAALPDDRAREGYIAGLYWRGTVYDVYEAGQWLRSRDDRTRTQLLLSPLGPAGRSYEVRDPLAASSPEGRAAARGPALEQTIEVVALSHPVAFALDRPVRFESPALPLGTLIATDFEPRWSDEVSLRMFRVNPANPYDHRQPMADFLGARYRVFSRPDQLAAPEATHLPRIPHIPHIPVEELPQGALANYLRLPASLTPRVAALASQIMAGRDSPAAKTQAVVDWLRHSHGYTTDLRRDERVADPVEDFLFVEQAGHCEYFASAAAILLRLGGVPTRYVNGFLGGEWNTMRDTVTVREGRAHSWIEAYLGREGWVRIDATPAQSRTAHMSKLGQLLDSAELFWGRWVIEYSASQQFMLAQRLGQRLGLPYRARLPGRGVRLITKKHVLELTLVLILLALVRSWRQRGRGWAKRSRGPSPRRADRPVVLIYQALLKRLAAAGAARRASETPHEYLARLREAGVEGASELGRVTDAYASARYGDVALAPSQVEELRRAASLVHLPK
ncbi:MAG: DUF3488 and transglutaminase-like domain-containing protein [Polyangia bacterium]